MRTDKPGVKGAALHRTRRYVLRPDTTADDVDDYAQVNGWPVVHQNDRDRESQVDGQIIWATEGHPLWDRHLGGYALHYIVDATAGIGYIVVSGEDQEYADSLALAAAMYLNTWTVEELYREYDEADAMRAVGQSVLRLGLAAPPEFDEGVFDRITDAMASKDPAIRYSALWGASYTGYWHFVEPIRELTEDEPEDWIRQRAQSVIGAFESAREEGSIR
ncbi:hypothetical protein OIE63_36350 [Streptomyces sp. NBC_01795]|uniref:hypothetical protein n=1 Tax=unclassified Streptomyces TaxID=2593676 RepID=UPI002DDC2A7F|nr:MULTISPECIES: hypothetical protein [unclassified Streptomyces]WSA96428.1 hypothetical protein OIE63_36350 [Streptomyces sp. NBC_01795]WSS10949.1 hypothetical protein OG533_02785 [Streptomyces sp. NBC_01186]